MQAMGQLEINGRSVDCCQVSDILAPEGTRGYSRVSLHRDDGMEVAAARWTAGGESVLHGHGDSAAVYSVLSGTIEEERWFPENGCYRYECVVLKAGDKNYLPAGAIHKVRAIEESVTLHCYSPAPCDATEEVPAETMILLEEAKARATRPAPKVRIFTGLTIRPNVVEVARQLADVWGEREAKANKDGELTMPDATLAEMRASGILAAPMPHEFGGWGATLAETVQAIRTIAQKAPSTALALVMPLGNAATCRIPEEAVSPSHHEALRESKSWIADKVRRGKILAVANSEPGAGGDLQNTRTIAVRGDDGVYRLSGKKSFATFGRDADYYLCAARRAESVTANCKGVVDGFFVAKCTGGLTVDDKWDPLGMRPTASVGLLLEDAASEAMMGFPGCLEGVSARHWSTVLFGAVFLGVGEGALREGMKQVGPEAVWARGSMAEKALGLDAAAGFLESVAASEVWPTTKEWRERTMRCKTFITKTTVDVATHVAMVSGGRCYTANHPVMRFLADALAGPLLRPPLPQAMDALVKQMFPPPAAVPARAAA